MTNQLPKEFLALLCCPKRRCRGDLREESATLICTLCGDIYSVHNGIPVLFPNADKSKELHARHWDLEGNAKSYAKKYDSYIKKQGTAWGLYTHESELLSIRKLTKDIDLGGKIVLDLGCGNGRLLTEYSEAKTKIGLDASLHLLLAAKDREPTFWFVCAQAEDLPLKDAVGDFSISIRVFQHLRAPEDAFNEMVRVTKPSGFIALENYNTFNLKALYKSFRMSKPIARWWPWGLGYDDYTSYRDIQKWSKNTFVQPVKFVGAGWGFYFYILEFLKFRRFTPQKIQKMIYDIFFTLEKMVSAVPPFSHTMEKICFIGSVQGGVRYKKSLARRVKERIRTRLSKRNIDKKIKRFENRNYAYASSDLDHLKTTVDWLIASQEATPDSGFSRGYSLIPQDKANRFGWQPSYPETSGYIIPTLFAAAKVLGDVSLINRALSATDWECNIQMENGAIQGGNIVESPRGAVFDTGQVIRGFNASWQYNKNEKYKQAGKKAADWIISREYKKSGVWKEDNATGVSQSLTTYNIYALAPIAELGVLTGNEEYKDVARRAAEYTLSMQEKNGWFKDCDFKDPNRPLLHTIAYAIDGLFDCGMVLNERRFIDGALRALDNVLKSMKEDGEIGGRLDKEWKNVSDFACLTGMAQIGVTACKAYKQTNEERYKKAVQKITYYLKVRQNNYDITLAPLGSLWGSWPIGESYGYYQALNWPAKYFADLLILQHERK